MFSKVEKLIAFINLYNDERGVLLKKNKLYTTRLTELFTASTKFTIITSHPAIILRSRFIFIYRSINSCLQQRNLW